MTGIFGVSTKQHSDGWLASATATRLAFLPSCHWFVHVLDPNSLVAGAGEVVSRHHPPNSCYVHTSYLRCALPTTRGRRRVRDLELLKLTHNSARKVATFIFVEGHDNDEGSLFRSMYIRRFALKPCAQEVDQRTYH